MCTELITRYWFTTDHVPLKAFRNGGQVTPEFWTNVKDVWEPSDCKRYVLKQVWIDCNTKSAVMVIQWYDPPRYKRHAPSGHTDFKVITNPVYPLTEPPLKHQSIKVVNLIPGSFARPHLNGILGAEWMA